MYYGTVSIEGFVTNGYYVIVSDVDNSPDVDDALYNYDVRVNMPVEQQRSAAEWCEEYCRGAWLGLHILGSNMKTTPFNSN